MVIMIYGLFLKVLARTQQCTIQSQEQILCTFSKKKYWLPKDLD